jgi:hypothetical protein
LLLAQIWSAVADAQQAAIASVSAARSVGFFIGKNQCLKDGKYSEEETLCEL